MGRTAATGRIAAARRSRLGSAESSGFVAGCAISRFEAIERVEVSAVGASGHVHRVEVQQRRPERPVDGALLIVGAGKLHAGRGGGAPCERHPRTGDDAPAGCAAVGGTVARDRERTVSRAELAAVAPTRLGVGFDVVSDQLHLGVADAKPTAASLFARVDHPHASLSKLEVEGLVGRQTQLQR